MNKKYLIAFLFLATIFESFAQGGDNSPYSRFGLGDLVDENFMHLRSMGKLGSSYADIYNINIVNPASYSALRATAFDIGFYTKNASLQDNNGSSSNQWSANLEYISLAFPLTNPINDILEREERDWQLGMSFTLMPNSVVSYNITSDDVTPGQDSIRRNFRGDGGSYKFYWGNAVAYKNFAFGVNLGYLFGNITYDRNIIFSDLNFPYNSAFSTDYSLNGFIYKLGAQYTHILNKKQLDAKKNVSTRKIIFGLHGRSNTGFRTSSDRIDQIIQQVDAFTIDTDTLTFELGVEGKGTLPGTFGFGLTYYNGTKFSIGFDYETTAWKNYVNEANPQVLNNTSKISVGGSYRPNPKSYNNFLKRAHYRYGFYYQQDPREIDNKALTNYGVTLGLGLPFIYQRKISHANIGVDFGRRGQGTVLRENFAQINFSFTFNDDEWFIKRKYD